MEYVFTLIVMMLRDDSFGLSSAELWMLNFSSVMVHVQR